MQAGFFTLLLHRRALRKFHVTDSQTHVIKLRVIEAPKARDQIAFCAFHSFLGRFPFVRTDRPDPSRSNENFTFDQNYPTRSVKS